MQRPRSENERPGPLTARAPRWLLSVALLAAGCTVAPRAGPRELRVNARTDGSPRVLVVIAHPDDDTTFAATLFQAGRSGARCDVAVVTNGEGGFKYATLAEDLYGAELTIEAVGRSELPEIRRREMIAGCELLGVETLYWFGESDHRYTQDVQEVLGEDAEVWNLDGVQAGLARILESGDYDYVFTLVPDAQTHAHHKAATILALRTVSEMVPERRPLVLCARVGSFDEPERARPELPLPGFPETALAGEPLRFDRTRSFGHRGRLDYRIVVNWVIAAHKSQGTMQLAAGRGDFEEFFPFDVGAPSRLGAAHAWFEALAEPNFPVREYEESAGTNATR